MAYTNATHIHNRTSQTGVVLVNLGTPEGLGYFQLRRYLGAFLADPRVVEKSFFWGRGAWLAFLQGVLLQFLPFASRRSYARIWDDKKNESPLRSVTRQQASTLQKMLDASHPARFVVTWAMRYGGPSLERRVEELNTHGCRELLVLPLYPQYSAVTTASVCDALFEALKPLRWMPTLRIAAPYYDNPHYISALATSVETHLKSLSWQPEVIVCSYHGLPVEYFKKGDPYFCHCQKTTRLLAKKLSESLSASVQIPTHKILTSFQSRFGPKEWLQPYTVDTLKNLRAQGVQNVAVVTPGFAADCVETLGEIAQQAQETFLHAGGTHFTYIPCLNASKNGMEMLKEITLHEVQGWESVRP